MVFTRDAAAAAQAGAATTMTRGEVFVWREDCRLVGGVSFEQRSRSVYWNVTAIVVVHAPIGVLFGYHKIKLPRRMENELGIMLTTYGLSRTNKPEV